MKSLLSLALATVVALGCGSLFAAEPLKVGDTAPDFELKGSDGKTYKLAELLKTNKAVVVAWFPRAFTGGCTKECKSMKENSASLKGLDVAYFTASTDPIEGEKGNKAFAESLSLDYPILSDPDTKVSKAFGILNDKGNAANRVTFYIGEGGKVLYVDKGVKTESHGADVAAKLKELGVGAKKS
ncbi:peroxiredoxin [Anatilimnocola floriformis]|uniref:peroxiredoxin n=1 Tax=Anatilimnocola floriformis TaxID=2948575 RepID=UPI0020C3963C|nr:peroxiredoxin [Anatilimnocola floriformis]